jgi:hypothetical protein
MTKRRFLAGAAVAAVLATTGATSAHAKSLVALSGNSTLVTIDYDNPRVLSRVNVTGISLPLLGIDVRPKDNQLYGLVSDGSVVTINPGNGKATFRIKLTQTLPAGVRASVDFNPVADLLRVIGSDGTNFAGNVDTGVVTPGAALTFSLGPPPNPFGGVKPSVIAAAYTNSRAGAKGTFLFDIEDTTDGIYLQFPPGAGTLTNVGAQLGISPGNVAFDIATDGRGTNFPWLINGNRLFRPGLFERARRQGHPDQESERAGA